MHKIYNTIKKIKEIFFLHVRMSIAKPVKNIGNSMLHTWLYYGHSHMLWYVLSMIIWLQQPQLANSTTTYTVIFELSKSKMCSSIVPVAELTYADVYLYIQFRSWPLEGAAMTIECHKYKKTNGLWSVTSLSYLSYYFYGRMIHFILKLLKILVSHTRFSFFRPIFNKRKPSHGCLNLRHFILGEYIIEL
jgi:hypothetical protein